MQLGTVPRHNQSICTAGTNRSLAVEVFCNGLSGSNDEYLEAMKFNSFPSQVADSTSPTTAQHQQLFARNRVGMCKGAEKNTREVPHWMVPMLKKMSSPGLQVSTSKNFTIIDYTSRGFHTCGQLARGVSDSNTILLSSPVCKSCVRTLRVLGALSHWLVEFWRGNHY